MSFLLDSLSSAARALEAQSYGLETTGQNLANINTPGYARRTVVFAEVPPTDPMQAGGGVTVTHVIAQRAALIQARLWHEQPAASEQGEVADNLSVVQTALGKDGASIDQQLSNFYGAFSALAQDPTSSTARFQVASAGQSLAQTFNTVSSGLSAAQQDADTQVRAGVDQVNVLAAQLASINTQLSGAGEGAAATLVDQQTNALSSLSQLIDFSAIHHADGSVDVSIGNGRALVTGAQVYDLTATSGGPQGFATISTGDYDVSAEISGGSIGGQLRVRDTLIPGYVNSLDQLAYGVANAVNTAHQSGYDLNGAAGTAFFTPLASSPGAAATISVNSAIVSNTSLIAAAGAPVAGDNQNARAIAGLASAALPAGGTPLDGWSALVYRVGSDLQTAQQEQSSRSDVVSQLQNLNDQTSGVSMDEEAAAMMRFQRAYEANARFFGAVNQSFDTLMAMVTIS
jgi:flagellar hook-associated protein 1 FlgK